MKEVVLAFSGGLDTSYCAVYLNRIMGLRVHAVLVQTGGFTALEIEAIKKHAYKLGVATFHVLDVTQRYYDHCIKYLIYGNVLRNNVYPLCVSAERMMQAWSIAAYASRIKVDYVAHGSTGAGNDQVRFDVVFQSMIPEISILTPVRDQQLSREEEVAFLKGNNISMNYEKAAYSINKGLWGTSIGGKETLNSKDYLPEDVWPTPVTETQEKEIVLHFSKGQLCGLDNSEYSNPVEAILKLQEMAQPFGIGRDINVGDTIIGIKGRVGFEAAAPMLIIKAHHHLEKHTLTKWQLYWKDQLSNWYGTWLHEGMMLDPVMRNIEKFLIDTQVTVSGRVFMTLYPYRFVITGIESEHDLMNNKYGTYGEMNSGWTGEDVKGFSKIFGNQQTIFHEVNKDKIDPQEILNP